jgi:hypothetical protein
MRTERFVNGSALCPRASAAAVLQQLLACSAFAAVAAPQLFAAVYFMNEAVIWFEKGL